MLTAIAWVVATPILIVLSVLVAEIAAGLRTSRTVPLPASSASMAVVIPAHNEGLHIGDTLVALRPLLPDSCHAVVIADNCMDGTAGIAREAGFEVIERHDPQRRGKGYALAFAREALSADPPEIVGVLDADCLPQGDALCGLRDAAAAWNGPVQAINLLRGDRAVPPMVQISNFAFLLKNLVRQRGADRIGTVVTLGGTGMAMPWHLFASAPLASGDLAEDLSLGIFALRHGHAPRLVPAALVLSDSAAQVDTLVQRSRWEHGFLAAARNRALPLLWSGLARLRWSEIWLALHLCVPPLALLGVLSTCALTLTAGLAIAGGSTAPLLLLFAANLAAAILILGAWAKEGRSMLSGPTLARLPLYLLWKLPVYLKLASGRRAGWVRTRRTGE